MEQLSGADLRKRAFDTTDGHQGASQAPKELDQQCEKMKVRMLACPHYAGGPLCCPGQVTITSWPLYPVSTVSASRFMPSLIPQCL